MPKQLKVLGEMQKQKTKKIYGTEKSMIHSYLAEFLFRKYCKNYKLEVFEEIMRNIGHFHEHISDAKVFSNG